MNPKDKGILRKNPELIIEPTDPFKGDALAREISAEILKNIVQSTSQPFVIALEAPWGWGKTTFLQMWKAYLENEHNHHCLHFNAWETDFSDDPLIAFIGEMDEFINSLEEKTGEHQNYRAIWNKLKSISGGVLKRSLPIAIQLLTQGILSPGNIKEISEGVDEISEPAKNLAEEKIQQYSQEKLGIENFRESLLELSALIKKDEKINSPLIFIVDELDRCRPDYAIALLERIKHLFNVQDVVFILAIDRRQLVSTIRSIYGQNMDADGYLRRFIDFSFKLPPPSLGQFSSHLYKKFAFSELFNSQSESNFCQKSINLIVNKFNFSLRTQEQYFTELNLLLRGIRFHDVELYFFISFLVALKSFDFPRYELLKTNSIEIDPFLEIFDPIESMDIRMEKDFPLLLIIASLEAFLILNYSNESEKNNRLDKYSDNKELGRNMKTYARKVMAMVNKIQIKYDGKNEIHSIINNIDLIK